jgi:hypothetical protein
MKIATTRHCQVLAGALATSMAFVAAISPGLVLAAEDPTKWVLSTHVGRNVNKTKKEANAPQEERNECTIASKNTCSIGEEGAGPREFVFPESVAVSKLTGNVYVSDQGNHRVEVLEPEGGFVSVFGWKVNKTTGGSICTAEEIQKANVQCGAGERGTGLAGQQAYGESLTVDPTTGNVYVLDVEYHRVEEYTAVGEFVLMLGGDVNKKGGGICTKAEETECQAGIEGSGHGAFAKLEIKARGNLLTFGPEGLLYVGDEGRIQKFETDGTWVGQLSLTGLPTGETEGVAVDTAGDVFVADSATTGIHEYTGEALQACVVDPTSEGIHGMALDSADVLAVSEEKRTSGSTVEPRALTFETQGAGCGKQVGEITPPSGGLIGFPLGLAFSLNETGENEDRLYIANANLQEIEGYLPILFPTVKTCPTTSVTFTSALLCGEVDPNEILARGFFRYGTEEKNITVETSTAFEGMGNTLESTSYELTSLTPNQTYYDEAWVEASSEGKLVRQSGPPPAKFRTPTPPPVVSQLEAAFVTDGSAVLSGTVNPEHALTGSHFEYAQCENVDEAFAECKAPRSTPELTSEQYGANAVIQEISGLTAQSVYVYRLVANNKFEYGGKPEGGEAEGEGHLTTAGLPVPQATTGIASAVMTTSALIAGTVDPDGQPATYVFELGVYNGAGTQYGIVFSDPAAAGSAPIEESFALSGLQPATTYAYRIGIKSGYVRSVTGETMGETRTFTTQGQPTILQSPPALQILPTPTQIKFPTQTKPRTKTIKCKHGYKPNTHNKCVKNKKTSKTNKHH